MHALLQRQQPCACAQLRPATRVARVRFTCAAGSGSTSEAVNSCSTQQQAPFNRRAVLEGILAVVVATSWGLQSPGAATAAGAPRDLTPEQQDAVNKALSKFVTKAKAPVVLRLAYHDAGTFSKLEGDGGMNASIQYELSRPESFGLKRGWGVLQQAMAALKGTPAEGVVSYADLIALAGAYAVGVTGGPRFSVPVGRSDAAAADPPGRMAAETSGAQALKDNFAAKGFNVRELVALSGAHTLGGKGFGDPVAFDNAYYTALLAKPWLNTQDEMSTHIGLPSDHVLPEDPECLAIIQEYAGNTAAFHRDFAAAYTKMTMMGAQWA